MLEPSPSYSTEWWLGYHAMGPKTRNPYGCTNGGEPSCLQSSKDWADGWQTRFYGENPRDHR